jgi:osmotically-inducible protein OsmY
MSRDVIFGKGRGWRPDDREYRRLRLGPGRGARVGEYASPEPNEYSDSYYGPGDNYARRADPSDGYTRDHYDPRYDVSARSGSDVQGGAAASNPDYMGYGRLRPGQRSWADLGVHSVDANVGEAQPSFAGRGPKGYVRTDERLREIICERLTNDPHIDASEVDVQVANGEVTLTGAVSERAMKWHAEDLAEHCARGAVVHNRLRVQRSDRS